MSITYTTAISSLEDCQSLDDILKLADNTSIKTTGKVTVLYSGKLDNGTKTGDIIESLIAEKADVRLINNTAAAELMESDDFIEAVGHQFGVDLKEMKDSKFSSEEKTKVYRWLFDATEGPWATTSKRFIEDTVGEVRVLGPNAPDDRTFALVELPAALENQKITTIDGIPRAELVALSESGGISSVFERVRDNTWE